MYMDYGLDRIELENIELEKEKTAEVHAADVQKVTR